MYVALYSGKNRLEQLVTSEKPITSVIEWNETLTFKLDIADLPRFKFVLATLFLGIAQYVGNCKKFQEFETSFHNCSAFFQ